MTNYEKIKAMSVEEMARFLCDISDCYHCPMKNKCRNQTLIDCLDGLAEWLLKEAEE